MYRGSKAPSSNTYSWRIAFVYIFNLIFGAGALTLPKAFAETGLLLGAVTLCCLATVSYCTATFIVEAMAITNAILRHDSIEKRRRAEGDVRSGCQAITAGDERTPLLADDTSFKPTSKNKKEAITTGQQPAISPVRQLDYDEIYEITTKVEVGEMAKILLHKSGVFIFYLALSLYMYGSLCVYACSVAKSLTTIACGATDIFQGDVHLPCDQVKHMSIMEMYRCILGVFTVMLSPFAFFSISKTKFLQVFTTAFRWISFAAMVVLSIIRITNGQGNHSPQLIIFNGLPSLLGIYLASLMCQNSIPSIVAPIADKKNLKAVLLLDFGLVTVFNVLVVFTAVFAFPQNNIQDLYTLNFSTPPFFKYMLQLFPAFTLSANFPIIAITLRENLITLFLSDNDGDKGHVVFLRRFFFPLLSVIPPIAVAYSTYDVGLLVAITGAYPGAILQYMIPAMLVYFGRIHVTKLSGSYANVYRSPFAHVCWIVVVVVWYVVFTAVVTARFIMP